MKKIIDSSHPFYRPLWIRLAIVAFCFGWASFEGVNGNVFWASLFGGFGALAVYELFIAYRPTEPDKDEER